MMQARLVIIEGNSSEGIVSVTEILYRSSRLELEKLPCQDAVCPSQISVF